MEPISKPGWHTRGYLPHFDGYGAIQHVVLSSNWSVRFDEPLLAPSIEQTLRFRDGQRYCLHAWCIMPDHIHVACVFSPGSLMGRTVRNWKSWITRRWNASAASSFALFEADYFDRYARSLDQAERLVGYIENNPVAAGLVEDAADWRWGSAWHKARGWEPGHDWAPLFLPDGSR
jgi:putative transposase